MGPATAFKLIQAEQSIEGVIQSRKRAATASSKPPRRSLLPADEELYLAEIVAARGVFNTVPPITDEIRAAMDNVDAEVDWQEISQVLESFDLGFLPASPQAGLDEMNVDFFGATPDVPIDGFMAPSGSASKCSNFNVRELADRTGADNYHSKVF